MCSGKCKEPSLSGGVGPELGGVLVEGGAEGQMEQGLVGHGKEITSWNETGAIGILSWRVVWSDYVIPG